MIQSSLEAETLELKSSALNAILAEMSRVAVAFSGGVDSSFLLQAAVNVLRPDNVLAVTVTSPLHPSWEQDEAQQLAHQLGVDHQLVAGDELGRESFVVNPPDRCYICKFDRFSNLIHLAQSRGFRWVADGGNVDDLSDYRPGLRAVEELGVRSPLKEAGLHKAEIRALSRIAGLPTWNRPSRACLASRFPYGEVITREALHRVDQAERFLFDLGASQTRVRHHGPLARVEVPPDEMDRILSHRAEVVRRFKELGFVYVTLDLAGFRSGSMNEVL